jgi:Lipase (class 3)
VDHEHQSIVLAIRGTFTIAEIITDVSCYTRPFGTAKDAEAHYGFATMAERTWTVVRPTIFDLLQQYTAYDLVITGHSLGGAVASLINVLVQDDENVTQQMSKNQSHRCTFPDLERHVHSGVRRRRRQIRCIVYAAAPCYTQTMSSCTNYVYGQDIVSFVSLYSVQHLLHRLRAVDEYPFTWYDRYRLVNGWMRPIPAPFAEAIRDANINYHHRRHHPNTGAKNDDIHRTIPKQKDDAPLLIVPASHTVWMKEVKHYTPDFISNTTVTSNDGSVRYDSKICDSVAMAKMGLYFETPNTMLSDHLCGRYEDALHNMI